MQMPRRVFTGLCWICGVWQQLNGIVEFEMWFEKEEFENFMEKWLKLVIFIEKGLEF